jgi:hypothetical protein
MKCAERNFIVTMVNAVVDSKYQYDRSEIVAYFESQTVLLVTFIHAIDDIGQREVSE